MMKFLKINNKGNFDLQGNENLFHSLGQFAQKRMGFNKPPVLNLVSDTKNADKALGKTAYYDPQSMSVTIYTDNRHTKDILRSLAHELVHHTQNENGMLNDSGYHGTGYAQKNKDLRQSEKEAYLKGNMCFRDWEDGLKQSKPTIYNEWRIKTMSTKKWKNNELMENLSEKFGFKMDLGLLKEGEIPAGLKKYQDEQAAKKKGKDSDEDEKSEEEDSEEKEEKDSDDEKSSKDGKMPMKDEPAGKDLNKDGKKGHGKVPAFLKEKEDKKEIKESRMMKIIKNEIRKQLKEMARKKKRDLTDDEAEAEAERLQFFNFMGDKDIKDMRKQYKDERQPDLMKALGKEAKDAIKNYDNIETVEDAIEFLRTKENREENQKKTEERKEAEKKAREAAKKVREAKDAIKNYDHIKTVEDAMEFLSTEENREENEKKTKERKEAEKKKRDAKRYAKQDAIQPRLFEKNS